VNIFPILINERSLLPALWFSPSLNSIAKT
jgi:hypothetical protein